MSKPALHQFLTGATEGDAITAQAMVMQRWLTDLDYDSRIYAQHIHTSVQDIVFPLSGYKPRPAEKWAVYHHSIGSDVPDFLRSEKMRLLLIYHNVTPAQFFASSDPVRMHLSKLGRRQLLQLRDQTELAVAVSSYNLRELEQVGYTKTAVLPNSLNPDFYDIPCNVGLEARLQQTKPNLLFVGRLAPNKKQEDLIKLLYAYRRLQPDVHLYLVGDWWEIGYDKWVEDLAHYFGVAKNLTLSGKVSQQDLVTYYKGADFYVSMSEHEGFGLPLLESMYFGVLVIAYGVTGVPETMGDAGILFFKKEYEALAELLDMLLSDKALRDRILIRQKERAGDFLEPKVRSQFEHHLRQLGLLS